MQRRNRGLYYWMRQLHLWLGLILGLYLVALGLSGSILVLAEPIDQSINPALRLVEIQPRQAAFSDILATVRSVDSDTPIMRVYPPAADGNTWSFWMGSFRDVNQVREIFINPYDASYVGQRRLLFTLVGFCKYVHIFLMLGMMGFMINGILGYISLLVLLTGLVLWWPRSLKQMASRLWVKWRGPWSRVNLDLHNAVGIWSLPLFFVVTFTGSALVFHGPIEVALVAVLGPESEPVKMDAAPEPAQTVTVDTMMNAIAAHSPTGRLARLDSVEGERPMRAMLWEPGDKAWHTYTMLTLDKKTGQITTMHRPSTKMDYAVRAFMPLHVGSFGGVPVQILYAILGLVPLLLFITGLWIWLRPKFVKRKAATMNAAVVQGPATM